MSEGSDVQTARSALSQRPLPGPRTSRALDPDCRSPTAGVHKNLVYAVTLTSRTLVQSDLDPVTRADAAGVGRQCPHVHRPRAPRGSTLGCTQTTVTRAQPRKTRADATVHRPCPLRPKPLFGINSQRCVRTHAQGRELGTDCRAGMPGVSPSSRASIWPPIFLASR